MFGHPVLQTMKFKCSKKLTGARNEVLEDNLYAMVK